MTNGSRPTRRIRIAHVTPTFPPYQGGTGNVCYHNAQELARRNHDVHVFTAAAPGTRALETDGNLTVHRLRPMIRIGNAPVLPDLAWAVGGFDIIHLHCPFILGAELTSLSAALSKTPLIVTYHSDLISSSPWSKLIFSVATWSSRYAVLSRAERVLFVSQGHAETCDQHVIYHDRRRSSILPNGVDTGAFCPTEDQSRARSRLELSVDTPLVGFVAGLDRAHHYKGLDLLLEALATPALQHVNLLVVGDGDLREHYERQAQSLGISGRVRFCGRVSHEELPPFYQACDVVTMPSRVPESFGLVVIEALACGIPVVASDGPGVRSLLQPEKTGLLVEANDPSALAAAIKRTLGDEIGRSAMSRLGRVQVESHYSWQQIGTRLEAIYLEVLDSCQAGDPRILERAV